MRPAPREHVGIVVGRSDYGELDRVVRLLTADRGRMSAFANGARRARSPYAGLDVGARVAVQVREGKGDLWRLSGATVEDGRVGLRRSLGRMVQAAYAAEVCGALAQADHPEPRLYGLLETALLLLDAASEDPHPAFLVGVEAKALTFAGFAPVLDRCVACTRPLESPLVLDAVSGGVSHAGCLPGEGREHERGIRAVSVTPAFVLALEAARRRPLAESLDLDLPEGPDRVLADAVEAHLGRALVSRSSLGIA